MEDVLLGILTVAVGALFCFRGYLTMRIVIPVWGAFVGFVLGAGLVSSTADERFLGSALAWGVGLAVAVVFGLLAYLYYEVSIMLAMAAVGFVIGTSLTVALGVTWSWAIILVGVVVGAVFGVIAVLGDMPMLVLVILTTLAGASTIVAGAMLVAGTIGTDDLTSRATTERLDDGWWWYAAYAVLVVVGIVAQLRHVDELRTSTRESWADSGGRQVRAG